MKYLSVCSGIEAATCAWHPLGFEAFAFSEIDRFPCAVLAHHYPHVPNFGDMSKFQEWPDATDIDVLVGGTPCQSFSVAGLRKGLDDPRGNLMLTYGAIAGKYRPKWLVWENVPGVLSSNRGRDFGTFLGMLGQLGYGFAYRILDAQYFGLAQRRRRVFVVGYLGDWRRAAAVLFERHGLQGHPAPSREAGEVAPTIPARSLGGGGLGTDFDCDGGLIYAPNVSPALKARDYKGPSSDGDGDGAPIIAFSCKDHGADASEISPTLRSMNHSESHANAGGQVAIAIPGNVIGRNAENGGNGIGADDSGVMYTLTKTDIHAVAFAQNSRDEVREMPYVGALSAEPGMKQQSYVAICFNARQDPDSWVDHTGPIDTDGTTLAIGVTIHGTDKTASIASFTDVAGSIRTKPPGSIENNSTTAILQKMAVRRLTPRECERLQGFSDDYTLIPWRGKEAQFCPDGPRYKALGNSMAVPVMRWIGERILAVSEISREAHECANNAKSEP